MAVDGRIERIQTLIQEATAQKQQEIQRLDQEIKDLQTELQTLMNIQQENMKWQTSIKMNLDPDVTKQLVKLCGKINAYIADDKHTYPYVVDSSLNFTAIAHALQMYHKTMETIQSNLSEIASFMCCSIHFNGNSNTQLCSSKWTGDSHFDIHLSLQGGAKDLRIFSGFTTSWRDPDYIININLTNSLTQPQPQRIAQSFSSAP
jgi:hypothetical protein